MDDNTGLGSQYSVVSGLAMTLLNGSTIVYDNNGIETSTYGSFYNNANGPPNAQKPGLSDLFSMSNYFPLVFAGHFRLAQPATITTLIGYFDALGQLALPFDPANPYVQYRMNIWSNAAGPLPKTTGNFAGDVFSSDKTAGTFSFADTGVNADFEWCRGCAEADLSTDLPACRAAYPCRRRILVQPRRIGLGPTRRELDDRVRDG